MLKRPPPRATATVADRPVAIDLAVIDCTQPGAEFHRYLQRLVDAGYGKRVMFGSDQMVWPEAMGLH
jgi:uncharacterized protein